MERAPLLGNPKHEVFERYAKCPVNRPLSLHRGPVGELGGGSYARTFEGKAKYIWVSFLDLEVIKILSLSEASASLRHTRTYLGSLFLDPADIRKLSIGVIWNFGRNRAPLI